MPIFDPLLSVDGLTAGYGRETILQDTSLTIASGECVGILGHNGAGKTTLLRVIAGLLPAKTGVLRYEGRVIQRWSTPRRVKAGIVLVPQGRSLFLDMGVEDNIRLGGFRRTAQETDNSWGQLSSKSPWFAKRRNEAAGRLSGGQQQLVAIARGITSQPRLLMVDEPSVGLAGTAVAELSTSLMTMREEGQTILLVEQNLGLATSVCDRFIVLREGRVIGQYRRGELPADELWSLF